LHDIYVRWCTITGEEHCRAHGRSLTTDREGIEESGEVVVEEAGRTELGGDDGSLGELRRSERRIRKLLTNTRDVVSLTDADGRLVYSTAGHLGALGYPSDFWDGLHLLSLIHPEDLDRGAAAWQQSLANPGMVVETEVRMRTAEEAWVDIVLTGVNLLDDPDVAGLVVTSRNVSDLRGAQRLAASQAAVLELIVTGAPLSEVFECCVDLVGQNGMGGRSSICLLEDERLEMRAGRAPTEANNAVRPPPRAPERSLCDQVLSTERPFVAGDVATAALDPAVRRLLQRLGIHAGWSHPILSLSSGEVIGTFCTLYDTARMPGARERQVAEAAAAWWRSRWTAPPTSRASPTRPFTTG
jgi:PAS domain S-box-containing protein